MHSYIHNILIDTMLRYNLQPVQNELCVQWNSIFFQAVNATCFGPTLSHAFTERFVEKHSFD